MQLHPWPARFDTNESFLNAHTIGSLVENPRFAYANVTLGDEKLFLKEPLDPECVVSSSRELLWAEFMNDFAAKYPQLHVSGPQIYAVSDQGSILIRHIDAPLAATDTEPEKLLALSRRAGRTTAALDAFGASWRPKQPLDETSNHTPYNDLSKRWQTWIQKIPPEARHISPNMIARATDLVAKYQVRHTPYASTAISHHGIFLTVTASGSFLMANMPL